MSNFVEFNNAILDIFLGKHVFNTNTYKIYLSNVAPNKATHAVKTDIAEISAGNGYSAGGVGITIDSVTQTGGALEVALLQDEELTASGGSIGPFRYAILYNDTHASDPLVCYWDYGSAITLLDGEKLDLDLPSNLITASLTQAA